MDDVDPWVEEVRVALALNGGISLAVWMGGCAVELDRARRTRCGSAPNAPANTDPRPPMYGALCDAFRRELVVDVMSGSSAGGINGALLAGAIANGRELLPDFLRARWLDLGDFSDLLQPLSVDEPTAVMQGDYFAKQLKLTFDDLLGNQPETRLPPLVPPRSTSPRPTRQVVRSSFAMLGGASSTRAITAHAFAFARRTTSTSSASQRRPGRRRRFRSHSIPTPHQTPGRRHSRRSAPTAGSSMGAFSTTHRSGQHCR